MISSIERVAAASTHRKLTNPILLFLAGHQPLAFGVGQMLYALAPLLALLNIQWVTDWAALLSEPDALPRLEQILTNGRCLLEDDTPHGTPDERGSHVLE